MVRPFHRKKNIHSRVSDQSPSWMHWRLVQDLCPWAVSMCTLVERVYYEELLFSQCFVVQPSRLKQLSTLPLPSYSAVPRNRLLSRTVVSQYYCHDLLLRCLGLDTLTLCTATRQNYLTSFCSRLHPCSPYHHSDATSLLTGGWPSAWRTSPYLEPSRKVVRCSLPWTL